MTSEATLPLEYRTQPDTAFFVHVEDAHCGAAHGGKADNPNVGQAEMLFPGVLTWVEERGDFVRFWIDAREISTFMGVASVAGQGQVGRLIIPTMLARNDVLNVERRKWQVFLPEQTVFAAIAGSATDKCADGSVHQLWARLARRTRAFACKIPIRSIASI